MTREIATVTSETDDPPPPPENAEATSEQAEGEDKPKKKDKDKKIERLSPVMSKIRNDEERSLSDWLSGIGTEGAFKVQLRREQPTMFRDPKTGKDVKTDGFLKTYPHAIDEEFIQRTYGGGTYAIKVTRRQQDGSFRYEPGLHRTIECAGDPLLDNLPTNTLPQASAPAAPQATESPVAREMLGILKDQLNHRPGIDPAMQLLIEQLRHDASARESQMAELRRELAQARKPSEDPVKEKLFETMLTGQSGHVEALRLRYEAELRQAKELHAAELQRVRDHAEAEIRRNSDHATEELRRNSDRAERELATVKQAHEREIAAMRASHEIISTTASATTNLQGQLLKADNARLERENTQLREDLRELRAKKDQSLGDKIDEITKVKDLLGDDGEKSNLDKLIEAASSPAAIEFVKGVVGQKGDAAPQQAAAGASAPQAKPVVVQGPDGQNYILRGGRLFPAKKKVKTIPAQANADGTVTPEIVLPQVDEETIKGLVGFLERAFEGGQDPDVVAQSGRAMVPEEILTWIRQHHSDQSSGVDLFMNKVARLPGTSPLTTQAGKNWLRKLGKALVGE